MAVAKPTIRGLKRQISQDKSEIREKNWRIAELESEILSIKGNLSEKIKRVDTLDAINNASRELIADYRDRTSELTDALTRMTRILEQIIERQDQ